MFFLDSPWTSQCLLESGLDFKASSKIEHLEQAPATHKVLLVGH